VVGGPRQFYFILDQRGWALTEESDGGPGWLRYASECGRMYVDDSTRKQRLVTLLNL